MRWFMYIAGTLAFVMAAISVAATRSDIQIIVAGIFVLVGVVAFGFAALLARLDGKPAKEGGAQ